MQKGVKKPMAEFLYCNGQPLGYLLKGKRRYTRGSQVAAKGATRAKVGSRGSEDHLTYFTIPSSDGDAS